MLSQLHQLKLPKLQWPSSPNNRKRVRIRWSDLLKPSQIDRRHLMVLTIRALRAMKRETVHFLHFLKVCYIDGLGAVMLGRFDRRQAGLIILATTPILASVALMTIPAILFPTPGHQAFYNFAQILSDGAAVFPMLLGVVTATLGFKIPLG